MIPAGVDISTLVDRTGTIRASVLDMQWTLLATAFLVMVVVFAFLRRITPTIAAGVAVPLARSARLSVGMTPAARKTHQRSRCESLRAGAAKLALFSN